MPRSIPSRLYATAPTGPSNLPPSCPSLRSPCGERGPDFPWRWLDHQCFSFAGICSSLVSCACVRFDLGARRACSWDQVCCCAARASLQTGSNVCTLVAEQIQLSYRCSAITSELSSGIQVAPCSNLQGRHTTVQILN